MSTNSLDGSTLSQIKDFFRFIVSAYTAEQVSITSDRFYQKAALRVYSVNPLLAAQIIYYFRKEVGPNYVISLLEVIMMVRIQKTKWAKEFYNAITHTPKDILDAIEIVRDYNLKATNAMRKGFALAFDKFDERMIAENMAWNESVRLIDVINLVHPKHTEAIGKLLSRRLDSARRKEEKVDMDVLFRIKAEVTSDVERLIEEIEVLEFK